MIDIAIIGEQQAIGGFENLLLRQNDAVVRGDRGIVDARDRDRGAAAIGRPQFVRDGVIKRLGGGLPPCQGIKTILGAVGDIATRINTDRAFGTRPARDLGHTEGVIPVNVGVVECWVDNDAGSFSHAVGIGVAHGCVVGTGDRHGHLRGGKSAVAITHLVAEAFAGAGPLGQVIKAPFGVVDNSACFKTDLPFVGAGVGDLGNAQYITAVHIGVVAFGVDLNRPVF